ncbi:thiol-disulfide oxidoreductase DCC family protein [Streptomyces sp. NPDC014623]|uniref:thiol-disulfide oxidoreductase DCC family protein n=1 Tax=Streptomyces sp. NPDC014623 TaxID=3364875 RepID=UPI0036FAA731
MRTRSVLLYDGDCAFCTSSVMFAERRIRPRCEVTPWQFADVDSFGTTRERAEYELLWITPAGTIHGGAQAVAKLLLHAGGGWPVLGGMLTLPPLRWIAHGVYRLVANNREKMPGGTPACALPASGRRRTHASSRSSAR